MRLTTFTDYALRVLIYLGSQPEERLSSIKEIANIYKISNNHLSKVVFELGKLELIETIRGRNGGIRLSMEPNEINIGWVVRQTEDGLVMAECFQSENNNCIITPACSLKNVLNEALHAYLNVLDKYTLADILESKQDLLAIFQSIKD